MSGLNDILNSGKGKIPEEKLLAYLEGRLSPEERHEVESLLSEEGMESDALEGLLEMGPQEAKQATRKLNSHLHTQLKDKRRRRKQPLDNNFWSGIAIILILLLCIIGYVVLRYALRH